MGENKKGGLGLLLGVATGAVLGVLFAPRKGKELRENFKKELQKGGTGLGTVGKNFAAMGKDMADTTKNIYESPSLKKSMLGGMKKLSGAAASFKALLASFLKKKVKK